jgi:hypothetical protein
LYVIKMATRSNLIEQLSILGIHLPSWPEEPEDDDGEGAWVQRGQLYADGVRMWRAQLRNAPDSTKGVVDQLLRHLCDTGQAGEWDQLAYAAIRPEVQGSPNYQRWEQLNELISSPKLTKGQKIGAVIEMARLGDSATLIDYVIDQAQTKRLNGRELSLLARIAAEELIGSKDLNDLENWNTAASLNELLVKLLGNSLALITGQADNDKTNKMEASSQLARCSSLAVQVEAIRKTLVQDAERRKYLPFGYLKRDKYTHYDDMGQEDQWQKEVYEFAASTARLGKYKKILDFGCGSANKLMKYFKDFEKIGVELDCNVQELRKRYPSESWIVSRIGEERLPPVDMIICSDVIEHLIDPQTLLEYLEKQDFRILIISTPERELVYSQFDKAERQFLVGPPRNKAHTMEWSYIEFHQMLKRWFKVEKHWISNEAQATQVAMCIHLRD